MDFSFSGAVKQQAGIAAGVGAWTGVDASVIMRRWREFTRSGTPVRFLCFEEGGWADVADEAAEELRAAFRDRRVFAEVAYGGRAFLFDFLRMARIDQATAEQAALGWIDDRGACFFPAPLDAGARKRRRDDDDGSDAESSSSGVDERSGESRGTGGGRKNSNKKARAAWRDGAAALEESDKHFQVVSKLFLSYGMAPRGAEITVVRRVAQGARAAEFQRQRQLLADARGAAAAAAKFAWYGAPAEDVADAVEQGIARTNARLHGDGVHLSPPQCPYTSAMLAKADENGEAHIVLCRVLMGRPEAVPAGSSQSQPSSDDYDSAVDNMVNPRWYVVWNKDMNTRILPEYVVSFKCTNLHARGSSEATSKLKKPSKVARDMFPTLLAEIEKFVPSYKCETLQGTYARFKKGQVKKDHFIRFLRNYIGDNVLTTVAKKLRGC